MDVQQLSSGTNQEEEERISFCRECGVCATILCFSTLMGIFAFIVLAGIAKYIGDPKNYGPYSLIFVSLCVTSLLCKFYTMYNIKYIQEEERIQRLHQVEEALSSEAQLEDIHSINAMDSRNSLCSQNVTEVKITETESVKDESDMTEDYPRVIYHGDTVEYVFGPLSPEMLDERKKVSKNAPNTFDVRDLVSKEELHRTDEITVRNSLNFNEELKDGIRTFPLKNISHLQCSSLNSCTDSLYSENALEVRIIKDESPEKKCITAGSHVVVPIEDIHEYMHSPRVTEKSSGKRQDFMNYPNTSVMQERITKQHAQFYAYDTVSISNSENSDGEYNKPHIGYNIQTEIQKHFYPSSEASSTDAQLYAHDTGAISISEDSDGEYNEPDIGYNIQTEMQKHFYPSSVASSTDALYSDNVTHGKVFCNQSVTTEYPNVICYSEPTRPVLSSLSTEKSISEIEEIKNDSIAYSLQKIITQQINQSDSLAFSGYLGSDEESYSEYEAEEHIMKENEDYPVVKHHGDIVEYIFGPLPARMLEERKKLMNIERNTDVSIT